MDWQIWIEKGDRPLPRKMVINYKSEPQSPQYMATLSAWETRPRFHPAHFQFVPPDDADQIEFLTEREQIENYRVNACLTGPGGSLDAARQLMVAAAAPSRCAS